MKLSDNLLQATIKANQIARDLTNTDISVDNLLYGIASIKRSMASAVLEKYYITTENMLYYLIDLKGPKVRHDLSHYCAPTKIYQQVIERAEEIATAVGLDTLTCELILLAIIDLKDTDTEIQNLFMVSLVDETELMSDLLDVIGNDKHEDLKTITKNLTDIIGSPIGNKRTPVEYSKMITQYGFDLTKKAEDGKVDPLIGRENEVNRIIQILGRKTKNNPILIGDPGVGKTSIVEGLANKIVSGDVPEYLRNSVVLSVNMGAIIAGTKFRGEFEDRFKKILDECEDKKGIILFIDEIHTIVNSGTTGESSIDGANIMKPYLSDGRIQLIGATTIDEYRKIIETDTALARRLQSIMVEEPTEDETIEIMKGLKPAYEKFHNIQITDEVIQQSVKLSVRYISDRYLPDKAIDVLDEASSVIKVANSTKKAESIPNKTLMEYDALTNNKEQAIHDLDIIGALNSRNKIVELCSSVSDDSANKMKNLPILTVDDVCNVISNWTKIPVSKLTEDEKSKLMNMEKLMHESIIGQDEAIKSIATAIRRNKSGLRDPKKPIASFMFLGSTGVGKTETVKTLAKVHYGSEDNIIRMDMSEYMEKHTVAKLIGAPPGYVGHDDGGQLTNAVRTKPYSIILFDEIEKAHPDVFNILLQILDEGRLTDSKGRTVDFKNTIIIMTSNLGATTSENKDKHLGFGANVEDNKKEYETDYNKMKEKIMKACKKRFRPEFLNRIDELIVYHNLSEDNIRDIIKILIKDLEKRLDDMNIHLELDESVMKFLIKQGTDLKFGARPLARAIQRYIMDGLSTKLLTDEIVNGDDVLAIYDEESKDVKFYHTITINK